MALSYFEKLIDGAQLWVTDGTPAGTHVTAPVSFAAIGGLTLGGGAELALCSDYRIMGADARIGFPEIHLGAVPGSGGLSRLPRLIGASRAMGLLLDGNPIEARQALEIGLVNEVVQNSPIEAAIARAKEWTGRASVAARAIKQGVLQVSRAKMHVRTIVLRSSRRLILARNLSAACPSD